MSETYSWPQERVPCMWVSHEYCDGVLTVRAGRCGETGMVVATYQQPLTQPIAMFFPLRASGDGER